MGLYSEPNADDPNADRPSAGGFNATSGLNNGFFKSQWRLTNEEAKNIDPKEESKVDPRDK